MRVSTILTTALLLLTAGCGAEASKAAPSSGAGGGPALGTGGETSGSGAGTGAGGADGDAAAPGDDPCVDPSAASCGVAAAMRLPAALPQARGNKYGDSDDAAMFGFALFFSSKLGFGTGCVECHAPESAFAEHKPVSIGKGTGNRNAPTVFNAGRLKVIFWDGRADSLWSQPLFAIENPLEMDSSRLELAHLMSDDTSFRPKYEQVFGPLPDMKDWPADGKPGDAAFDALPDAAKDEVNRVAANVGKALEAYMRKNATGAAPFDDYLGGDSSQMIDAAKAGLKAFIDGGCTDCHEGPMLTDESFHDVGFPSLPDAAKDPGRPAGIPVLDANVFNLAGPYADPGTAAIPPVTKDDAPAGAFRTPSLRNVARTGPYGHDGALTTLNAVLAIHAPKMSEEEQGNVIAFFQTLNGAYPPRPWNNWPSPQ
jgi:cytochrome c peroxidase